MLFTLAVASHLRRRLRSCHDAERSLCRPIV
jgi:hypothetical protein